MKLSAKTGATLAAAAAVFMLSGAVTAPTAVAGEKVQCFGVNSCKGTGACKTATNSCKGQNACKGQGFVLMSGPDCKTKGGTTKS